MYFNVDGYDMQNVLRKSVVIGNRPKADLAEKGCQRLLFDKIEALRFDQEKSERSSKTLFSGK